MDLLGTMFMPFSVKQARLENNAVVKMKAFQKMQHVTIYLRLLSFSAAKSWF